MDGPPAHAGTGVEVSKSFTATAHLPLINLITERARSGYLRKTNAIVSAPPHTTPPTIPADDYFAFLISLFPFRRRWANYSTKGVVVCPADDFVMGWFNASGMLKDGKDILLETVLKMVFSIGRFIDFKSKECNLKKLYLPSFTITCTL